MKLVEAGRLSPSGCNAQPWKFIVVDDPEAKKKLCDALVVEGGATGVPFREQVPAYIILVEQPAKVVPFVKAHYGDTQRFAQGDIGMAAMNMCYQALELGLSTCILGLNDQKKMEEYFDVTPGTNFDCPTVLKKASVRHCVSKNACRTEALLIHACLLLNSLCSTSLMVLFISAHLCQQIRAL